VRKSNFILILKTDAIGDYLLFRPYIETLSKNFPKHKLLLCGNESWKEIAFKLDKAYISKFIWLKKESTNSNPTILNWTKCAIELSNYNFDFAIYPVFSRESLCGDEIMKIVSAKKKISFFGNSVNQNIQSLFKHNAIYDKLITTTKAHDLYKNLEFIEHLTGEKLDISKVEFNLFQQINERTKSIVICPGASKSNKIWPIKNWVKLIEEITENFSYDLYIIGGIDSMSFKDEISKKMVSTKIINLIGKTSLMEVIELIAKSHCIITNDSMTVHIGIQTFTPTFCIFKGNHYGRFLPYPNSEFLTLCYPDYLSSLEHEERVRLYHDNEGLNIDLIEYDSVMSRINTFLHEKN